MGSDSRALGEMHIRSFLHPFIHLKSPALVRGPTGAGHQGPSSCPYKAGRLTWLTLTSFLPGQVGRVPPLSLSALPPNTLSSSGSLSSPHRTRTPSRGRRLSAGPGPVPAAPALSRGSRRASREAERDGSAGATPPLATPPGSHLAPRPRPRPPGAHFLPPPRPFHIPAPPAAPRRCPPACSPARPR